MARSDAEEEAVLAELPEAHPDPVIVKRLTPKLAKHHGKRVRPDPMIVQWLTSKFG